MIGKKKKILNVIFVLLCFVLTFWYVLHGEDLTRIILYMKKANSWYWLLGVFLVLSFIISESAIIYYLLNTLNSKVKFTHCCLYSFVGFFFSCITPSASGGQPAQVVFMRKDNVPISASTIVLLIVTISYKAVLIFYGALILIVKPLLVMHYLNSAIHWVYLGMVLNLAVVGFMLLLAVKPKLSKSLVLYLFKMIAKIVKSKKLEIYRDRIGISMENYVKKSEFLLVHKMLMLKVFFITFIQRTMFFAITYFVCLSFQKNALGFIETTLLQGGISLAVDMIPVPGGMGISEYLFLLVFVPVVGKRMSIPIMIVSRGLSYYTQLIISAIMTLVAYIKFYGVQFFRKEEI